MQRRHMTDQIWVNPRVRVGVYGQRGMNIAKQLLLPKTDREIFALGLTWSSTPKLGLPALVGHLANDAPNHSLVVSGSVATPGHALSVANFLLAPVRSPQRVPQPKAKPTAQESHSHPTPRCVRGSATATRVWNESATEQ